MAPRTTSLTVDLVKQYAYSRLCDEYNPDGSSRSLELLSFIAGRKLETGSGLSREAQIERLRPHFSKSVADKILLLEETMDCVYQIDADCDNAPLMEKTITRLREVMPWFKTNNVQDLKVRTKIHNHIYDIYQQLYPCSKNYRFEELKKMVRDIKENKNGDFDYDPLNIAAKRTDYFMRDIPAKQRYALLLEIQRKTKDSRSFSYDDLIARVGEEYTIESRKERLEQREANQERYSVIRQSELPNAQDNQTKIELYNELLTLINDQDFGKTRKFNEKKTIYNHLIDLYQAEKMTSELEDAYVSRRKFINAEMNAKEAARVRGYQTRA